MHLLHLHRRHRHRRHLQRRCGPVTSTRTASAAAHAQQLATDGWVHLQELEREPGPVPGQVVPTLHGEVREPEPELEQLRHRRRVSSTADASARACAGGGPEPIPSHGMI